MEGPDRRRGVGAVGDEAEAPLSLPQARKLALEAALGAGRVDERWLWHGTTHSALASIQANGFMREYNSAAVWGVGTYFAARADYSLDPHYAQPHASSRERCVLLSRVLVGEPCLGRIGMRRPDPKPGSAVLHESMVDNLADPTVFVLSAGSDNQAYPEILITLRYRGE